MSFFHIFSIIRVEPFIFNILKPLLKITVFTYHNILKHMQLNILQLYLNGLMIFFTFLELTTFLHESNHPL
jgi:hypothetical protein